MLALSYPLLEKTARTFRAGIAVELCAMSETSTLSGRTCKSKSREERLELKCQLRHM